MKGVLPLIIVVAIVLLLLAACLPPEGQTATNVSKAKPAAGTTTKAPVQPAKTNATKKATPTAPVINMTALPCRVTPALVQDTCHFVSLPTVKNCSFDAGIQGTVLVGMFATTKEGFDRAVRQEPGSSVLSDHEPWEAFNEIHNRKFVWRFEQGTLTAVEGVGYCTIDNLRQLALLAGTPS
jgi:hypothetical protein